MGGAPGKECVERNGSEDEAADRLVVLIKERGCWVEASGADWLATLLVWCVLSPVHGPLAALTPHSAPLPAGSAALGRSSASPS